MSSNVTDIEELFDSIPKPKELNIKPRETYIKVGCRASAKGSAYVEYGNTKVFAHVDPPKEMTSIARKLNNNNLLCAVSCTFRFTNFAAPEINDQSEKEIWMSMLLKKALEPMICRHEYPNFQIDIEVQVLDDNGCAVSAGVICGGAALVDAGIATYDLVAASTIAFYRGVTFINPDDIVEKLIECAQKSNKVEEYGIVIIASMHSVQQINECFHLGYMTTEKLIPIINYGDEINKTLLETIRRILVDKVQGYVTHYAGDNVDYSDGIWKNRIQNKDTDPTFDMADEQIDTT